MSSCHKKLKKLKKRIETLEEYIHQMQFDRARPALGLVEELVIPLISEENRRKSGMSVVDPTIEEGIRDEQLWPHNLAMTLELVSISISEDEIMDWPMEHRELVFHWAWQQHLIASDNEFSEDELLPKPAILSLRGSADG